MLRNREIRQFMLVLAVISCASVIIGFSIRPSAGLLAIISSAAFCLALIRFTRERYRRIASLSEQIDQVLHNSERLYISDADEGELSILQSEIEKMTLRIREQNEALAREKQNLADSLADIAHQLRTPLTSLNIILTLLDREANSDKRREMLCEAEDLFSQMEWLLNSLLKLSRLDAGIVEFNREKIDVNALIRDTVRPFLISMELHGIGLTMDIPAGSSLIGDGKWLTEAFRNIFKNSLENAGDNGCIDITCESNSLFTEISVHDSGAGLDNDDLPHVFERFYRGKRDGASGYGIGLALCRTVVVRQGGTIRARNHPGGGAVFQARFPK